ncbi:restriction endonuclease subunit S [Enterococcus faecium]|uniref:restriction endonuclease subunit S n=1 Tax=Enterococcus faecium TaxID=1352 RepID=UPI000F514712|nr:restriction endonuclease subunit S [Enterococcus faecium]ROX96686.1 restriction endonuclease subunit S [Enterococcus faecium]ROY54950.1 restriction endonuclease subunit S [Enterococcus faecium]ROY67762.1 restriction endonuclease subunit S [Enterococcus faecium]ROY99990.1 restriction endonuclease subunit S [Enterococcus faecium]ROZ02846.1 restriction endonuclease subunit S [Enterococcus faecium]
MSNDTQPEIRFPGFTEDWEERKLIDLVVRLNKSTNSSRLPKVEFEDIVAGEGRLNKDVSQKFDNRKGIEFLPNDILYGKLRPYLKNWLKATFTGVAIGDFWVFRAKKSDSDFIYSLIQADRYQKAANDTSGTKMPRSDWKKVSDTVFYIPNDLKEQQKIGIFFKKLDDTIALHQRKLDLLKETKKGFLQKMFPKNGAKVPEIRFPGFTEDWEQRKVGEIFKVTRGQVLAATETSESITEKNIYPVYSSQTKNDGLMGYYSDYLFDTAITWTTDGANAGTVNYRNGKFYSTNVNGVLLSDKGYANKAVAEIINRIAWKHVSKVGNPKLMNNVMSEIIITIPSVEEQETISRFFTQLDSTITLHERELDLLKETKKGFLQKMFV